MRESRRLALAESKLPPGPLPRVTTRWGTPAGTGASVESNMTKEAIKERVTAAPFRPFSVRLTDGRSYPVPGPDYASVSPNGRRLTVYTDGGNGVKILDAVASVAAFSRAHAVRAALLAAELKLSQIGFADFQIAAQALVDDAQLLTFNQAHFGRVPGLKLAPV